MKRSLLLPFFLLNTATSFCQLASSDEIKTSKGTLSIQPVLHSAIVFHWNGKTIYVDPYGGADLYAGLPKPDLILITDIHGDHLHTETLNALETGKAVLVAPKAVAEKLPENLKTNLVILGNGENTKQLEIDITAVPMYNLPETEDSRHPKGRGNGYILQFADKRIYISGDTEDITEMRELKNIDVAFVCMNLPYTMSVEQAASAALAFRPGIVYPFHYRTPEGFSKVEDFKKTVNSSDPKIEVRLRNWYPKE